ncbi:MAG: hypothetical protein JJU15_03435 [Pararhodobacter sp.]|nr:hypothetical protein [Pararhodobacter sp.]
MIASEHLFTPQARIAVLVPSANPTIEPELRFLLPDQIGLHVARLPVMPGTTLDERNLAYTGQYAEGFAGFGALALSAGIVGLTGPSYRLLPEGDMALCESLTDAAGYPVVTASLAILHALEALGAGRIALVSPYPEWLTEKAAAFWRKAGAEVVQVVTISEEFRAYALTTDEVAGALSRVKREGCDAVVMSGTGMLTVPACLRMSGDKNLPFLSSNLCAAWWLLHRLDIAPDENLARCTPQLAALLSAR